MEQSEPKEPKFRQFVTLDQRIKWRNDGMTNTSLIWKCVRRPALIQCWSMTTVVSVSPIPVRRHLLRHGLHVRIPLRRILLMLYIETFIYNRLAETTRVLIVTDNLFQIIIFRSKLIYSASNWFISPGTYHGRLTKSTRWYFIIF